MKRIGSGIILIALIFVLNCQTAFAAFEIVESYPADGTGGYQIVNMLVRLDFNEEVAAEALQDNHEDTITMRDAEGKKLDITVVTDPKNLNRVCVLPNENLADFTEYTVTLSPDFQSSDGDSLGSAQSVKFTTRDTSKDNRTSMILMAVMMVFMIGAAAFSTKRELKKKMEEENAKKVNPYKVAKEKGVKVEKVVEKSAKEKEKDQKRMEVKEKEKEKARKRLEAKRAKGKAPAPPATQPLKPVTRKYKKKQ